MEELLIKSNGQWSLVKGVANRIAPKPKGALHGDNDDAYTADNDKDTSFRGAHSLLRAMHETNPHSVKMIDGKAHLLLHRGISGDNNSNVSNEDFGKMKIHDDNSLEHGGHGMYTPDMPYANSFSGKNKTHSVWVPFGSIKNNAYYEHRLGVHSFVADNKQDEDVRDEVSDNGYGDASYESGVGSPNPSSSEISANHIVVTPGKYQHATPSEMDSFTSHSTEDK